ncbi:MAG TPA: biotin--[acetyl-CoA-carboxylase] ligase [Terriglobales bacterium]|nr:biotin--[acetyl-CoA-carboxylase] ligase [Terriglobales bacterium]
MHKATDVRLGRIVRLLMSHATVAVSGTKIAEEIGTSRSEVWRLIQQLRALGVDVAGHLATGYQLRAVPDLLLPEMLAPSLKGTVFGGARASSMNVFPPGRRFPQGLKPAFLQTEDGTAEAVPYPKPSHEDGTAEAVPYQKPSHEASAKQIHHYYKIASTNSEAMRCAAEGAPEGSVFLAEEQLAGRGRGAHSWHSARSAGIYCSVILRPAMPPSDALIFSLAVGLAIRAAVMEIAPQLRVDLKWPNDMLLGGKKFCGILTEMNAEAARVRYLVVGVGINVNQAKFPAELREIATSLKIETGTEWSRVELCAALLKSLDREYRSFVEDAGARDAIVRRFEENSSSVRGRKVSIEENGGLAGVTEGLDERGFLRVRTAEGLRTVVSGTVRIMGNL